MPLESDSSRSFAPLMSTHVFLLRHAETANPTVFHGFESDVDLSDKGVRQAEAIAAVLAAEKPEIVVSSAMLRARRTAETIARLCGVAHEIEPALHERKVGVLSGQPFTDNPIWAETSRRWCAGESGYAHAGAESLDELRDRLVPAWQRVTERHAGRRFVIVAHGIVCKVLIANLISGQTWANLGAIRNVAIHEFRRVNDAWTLPRFGWLPGDFTARGLRS
jgi:broad specificity phosphatase PhoE